MIEFTPIRWTALGYEPVVIDRMKNGMFAVRWDGDCLNKSGHWEREPKPSNRTCAFLERCRFESLEAAQAAFAKYFEKQK